MKKQGNKDLIFSNGNLSDEESRKNYEKQTRWNDHSIAIPVLFNFFHGTELILKGLVIQCGGGLEKNSGHRLSNLIKLVKECPSPPSKNLIKHFTNILFENGFEDFFQSNNCDVDSFYELFKYPTFKDGTPIKYWNLMGKGEIGLEKFEIIRNLASGTKEEIINWKKAPNNA